MQIIDTSILIIGSGGAGLRCAIELYEQGLTDIIVVGDRKFDDAHTILAAGGINAALATIDEQDTPQVHAIDTYLEGCRIGNPKLIEFLAKHAPEAIEDLLRFGANFHQEQDGRLTQRFFGAHTYRRTVFHGDTTGAEILRVLVNKANQLNIPKLEQLYIFKLLSKNGRAQGILGVKNNQFIKINAKITVIATGGYSNIYIRSSSRNKENFGEGIALAADIGAQTGDMEMVQFHPTGMVSPPSHVGSLVTEAVRGEGGILRNVKGKRFMKDYAPDKMELATRDVVARAIYQEILNGNGTDHEAVYLDISKRPKQYIKDKLPQMYKQFLELQDLDISLKPMEVAPTAHYTMGGIKFDAKTMQTNIKNLYATGECTMGLHGANRLGGNSLAEILVFGKRLGQVLANAEMPKKTSNDEQIADYLLDTNGTVDSRKELEYIRKQMWNKAGIIRNEKELKYILNKLDYLQEKIDQNGILPSHKLANSIIKQTRLRSAIKLAKITVSAALAREESRGAHFRSDFVKTRKPFRGSFIFQGAKMTFEKAPTPGTSMKQALTKFSQTTNYVHLE